MNILYILKLKYINKYNLIKFKKLILIYTYAIVATSITTPAINCILYLVRALAFASFHEPHGTSTSSIDGGLTLSGTLLPW